MEKGQLVAALSPSASLLFHWLADPNVHACLSLFLPFFLSFPPSASSSPDAADSASFDVQLGDIILTATDGLFDNMPDYMILRELKKLKVFQLLR